MIPDDVIISVNNDEINRTNKYIYLGHKITLGKQNQTAEISRRIRIISSAVRKLGHVLKKSKYNSKFKENRDSDLSNGNYDSYYQIC